MKNVIGVYGLAASGKTTFSNVLSKSLNALYISADRVGHTALKEKKEEIVKVFGEHILDMNGDIDRKHLGKIVFNNSLNLKKLENITHPYISEVINDTIKKTDKKTVIVLEAALLFRANLDKICSLTIYVKSKNKDIIKRLKKRGLPENTAIGIIKSQKDVKIKGSDADIIVNNTKDYNRLVVIANNLGRQYETGRIFKHKRVYK